MQGASTTCICRSFSVTVFLEFPVNIISLSPHHESETHLDSHPHFPPGDPEALRSQVDFPKFQILPSCGIILSAHALPLSSLRPQRKVPVCCDAVNLALTRWLGGKVRVMGQRRLGFWLMECFFFYYLKVKRQIHLNSAQTILHRMVCELNTIKLSPEEYLWKGRSQEFDP